jgi:hypothetical protein
VSHLDRKAASQAVVYLLALVAAMILLSLAALLVLKLIYKW